MVDLTKLIDVVNVVFFYKRGQSSISLTYEKTKMNSDHEILL